MENKQTPHAANIFAHHQAKKVTPWNWSFFSGLEDMRMMFCIMMFCINLLNV